jgi:hypothetical protein
MDSDERFAVKFFLIGAVFVMSVLIGCISINRFMEWKVAELEAQARIENIDRACDLGDRVTELFKEQK